MSYYPDLTPYTYGRERGGTSDLNVGWLSAEVAYPTAPPDPVFVEALRRCSLRPVRLFRGFHECEFCSEEGARGNGEIRVQGLDGRWYTAPTLVTHYVGDHHYSPPEPFVEATLRRAKSTPLLEGERLEEVRSLSVAQRFDLCLDALDSLVESPRATWLGETLSVLRRARAALGSSEWSAHRTEMREVFALAARSIPRAEDYANPDALQNAIVDAANHATQFLVLFQHGGEDMAGAETLRLATEVLERTQEARLLDT